MNEARHENADQARAGLLGKVALVLLASAALYCALYGPTVARATFLGDDWFHVEKVPRDRLPHLFFGDWYMGYRNVPHGFYRPLPRVLMQAGRALFGFWAPGYLFFSAAFHLANCLLVWLVAFRLTGRDVAAFIAALVFALYPTHPEALLQVSTLADPMATCGSLLAFWGYLGLRSSREAKWWVATAAGVLLGALSKESWATLPLLVVLYELIWWRSAGEALPSRKAVFRSAAFIGVGLAYVLFRHAALGGLGGYGLAVSRSAVRRTYDGVFQLIVFPFGDVGRWTDLVNVFTLLGAMAIVWTLAGFNRVLLFAMGWMVVTTAPLVTLVPRLHGGGRLVYVIVVGWSLFVGAAADCLIQACRARRKRQLVGGLITFCLAAPLFTLLASNCSDWRRSFSISRRLVGQVVEIVSGQPHDRRFAIVSWVPHFRAAPSERIETVAKAVSMLAAIEPARIDAHLATDAPIGTLIFAVTSDFRLRVGRVEGVERKAWSGERLEQWQPGGRARLVHARSDGSRDYAFIAPGDGLLSPPLAGATGFYSVLVRCHPTADREAGFVMWRSPGGWSFGPDRMAPLRRLPRLGDEAFLANPGWLSGLDQLLFLPARTPTTITMRSIEVARFQIAPFKKAGKVAR